MDWSDDQVLGRVLGSRFRVDKLIAKGGYTWVYRGHDLEQLCDVAIKILPVTGHVEAQSFQRFNRETRLISQLSHPVTVRYVAHGEEKDLAMWLAMELVKGRSLRSHIQKKGPMTPRQAAEIGVNICESLIEAHELGFLHRDLKPSNVMLERRNTGVAVKLIDFGAAKILEESGARANFQTQMGAFVGTPRYASPEALKRGSVGAPADVYGVGMVLWEALVGEAAVPSPDYADAVQMHLSKEPWTLPATVDCPPKLRQIIEKALAKEPEGRYQSCVELKDALERWIADAPLRRSQELAALRRTPAEGSPAPIAESDVVSEKGKFVPETMEDLEAESELFGEVIEKRDLTDDMDVMERSDLSEGSEGSNSHIRLPPKRHSAHAGVEHGEPSGNTFDGGGNNLGVIAVVVLVLGLGAFALTTMTGGDKTVETKTTEPTKTATTTPDKPVATPDKPAEPANTAADLERGDGVPTLDVDTLAKGMVASGWRTGSRSVNTMDDVVQTSFMVTRENLAASITVYESKSWEWVDQFKGQTEPPNQAMSFGKTVVKIGPGPAEKANGVLELMADLRGFRDAARVKDGAGDAPEENIADEAPKDEAPADGSN